MKKIACSIDVSKGTKLSNALTEAESELTPLVEQPCQVDIIIASSQWSQHTVLRIPNQDPQLPKDRGIIRLKMSPGIVQVATDVTGDPVYNFEVKENSRLKDFMLLSQDHQQLHEDYHAVRFQNPQDPNEFVTYIDYKDQAVKLVLVFESDDLNSVSCTSHAVQFVEVSLG